MQLVWLICALFAGTASLTATTSTTSTSKAALPRVLSPATPPATKDVQNSVTNWATSVNTVNDYLNNPSNKTKLVSAIAFAKDEPTQLATLMKVPSLSPAGVNAGKVLMGNFPSIVSNLVNVQSGVMTMNQGTSAVNFMRCCTVLPAISTLWNAAANAKSSVAMPSPNLPTQCSQMSCTSGASGSGTGNGTIDTGSGTLSTVT